MRFLRWAHRMFVGTVGYDRVHPELLEAVALGKIPDIDSLITSRVAIEEVVEKGFKALLNDKDSHGTCSGRIERSFRADLEQ